MTPLLISKSAQPSSTGISSPKCKLQADKETGRITVDSETTLTGIPLEACDYRLGNRSALEWILDHARKSNQRFNHPREV